MAGKELTDYLGQLLNEKGISLDTETCKSLKETSCYVVRDFSVSMQEANESTAHEKEVALPDGRKITLGVERFRVAESIFEPSINKKSNYDTHGIMRIQDYCHEAVKTCDPEI